MNQLIGHRESAQAWQVRILDIDGQSHGAGTLLNDHQILTSSHVVLEALRPRVAYYGQQNGRDSAPLGEVRAEFTTSAMTPGYWRAWVAPGGWLSSMSGIPGGIAILEVAGEIPPEAAPARLETCGDPQERLIWVRGYPVESSGTTVPGKMRGSHAKADRPWLDVRSEELFRRLVGFDGAGVVDDVSGQVIGCLIDVARAGYGWARMIPMERVQHLLPGIRLDLAGPGQRAEPAVAWAHGRSATSSASSEALAAYDFVAPLLESVSEADRELFAATLESFFGGYLRIPRYSSTSMFDRALFVACLEQPGALHELADILVNYYAKRWPDGQLAIALRWKQMIESGLDPRPLLERGQRIELYDLLKGLSFQEAASIYADVIEPMDQALEPSVSDSIGIARTLEAFNPSATGLPKIIYFLEEAARRSAGTSPALRDAIRQWTDKFIGDNIELRLEVLKLGGAPAPEPIRPALMFEVEDVKTPDHYRLTAKLQLSRHNKKSVYTGESDITLADLPTMIDHLLAYIRQPPHYGPVLPLVEFIVRHSLIDFEFDDFYVGGVLPRRLGTQWPVVVRSMDRIKDHAMHDPWLVKWQCAVSDTSSSSAPLWLWQPGSLDELRTALESTPPVSLGLHAPLTHAASAGSDEISIAVAAGVPFIIWCRERKSESEFAILRELLEANPLRELPDVIRALRSRTGQQGAQRLGHAISLLYDDASRIP